MRLGGQQENVFCRWLTIFLRNLTKFLLLKVNSVLCWNKTPTRSKAENVTQDSVQSLDRISQHEIWNPVS